MQFFPRDGHCLARFQVLDSTCHFLIPSPALANTLLLDSLESRNESVQEVCRPVWLWTAIKFGGFRIPFWFPDLKDQTGMSALW